MGVVACPYVVVFLVSHYIHPVKRFYYLADRVVLPNPLSVVIELLLKDPVDKKGGVADHEMSYDVLLCVVVDRSASEVCLHDPEAFLNLPSS